LTFEDVGERAIGNLKLTIAKVNWFSTYRVHHRVAARFREAARSCSETPHTFTARSGVRE
jgi:hypothetical protein